MRNSDRTVQLILKGYYQDAQVYSVELLNIDPRWWKWNPEFHWTVQLILKFYYQDAQAYLADLF